MFTTPRTPLLGVTWVLPLAWCLLLGASGGGLVRSRKYHRMSCRYSRSLCSFSCLKRVLLGTSQPPLQRMGHGHQTIREGGVGGIDKRHYYDLEHRDRIVTNVDPHPLASLQPYRLFAGVVRCLRFVGVKGFPTAEPRLSADSSAGVQNLVFGNMRAHKVW